MVHKNIRITGRVQGVAFRYSAREVADNLQIKGFVRNLYDGAVYIEAEGSQENMNAFLAWCHDGPSRARVEHVSVTEGAMTGYTEFMVAR